jgi:intracellular sulfur oxidation DsrE/DsrF family protein
MKFSYKLAFYLLGITLFSTNNISAGTVISNHKHSYRVDFNNLESQSRVLNNIQHRINENSPGDKELKIILFGKGRALSLDASALSNTKVVYGEAEQKIQQQIIDITNQGVRFIICKSSTSSYKHYSTKNSGTATDAEVRRLQSQGYDCNPYNP